MSSTHFKDQYDLDKRKRESAKVLSKYPDRIPVIVERSDKAQSDVPVIDKTKYLLPNDFTCSSLCYVIRKRLTMSSEKAIFLFVANHLPQGTTLVSELYERYKDEDGFLYVTYDGEHTFGSAAAAAAEL